MKKIFFAAILSFALISCTDTKKQEKDLLDQVIAVHDKVMGKESVLMKNKMQLDTMLNSAILPEAKNSIKSIVQSLEHTDANMENWMHNFDAENKGKSHDEIMAYLKLQKKQIDDIDKQFNAAIAASDSCIKSYKK